MMREKYQKEHTLNIKEEFYLFIHVNRTSCKKKSFLAFFSENLIKIHFEYPISFQIDKLQ